MPFLFDENSILQLIDSEIGKNDDLFVRKLDTICGAVYIVFLKSMTDKNEISKQVVGPILSRDKEFVFDELKNQIISSCEIEEVQKDEVVDTQQGHLQNPQHHPIFMAQEKDLLKV